MFQIRVYWLLSDFFFLKTQFLLMRRIKYFKWRSHVIWTSLTDFFDCVYAANLCIYQDCTHKSVHISKCTQSLILTVHVNFAQRSHRTCWISSSLNCTRSTVLSAYHDCAHWLKHTYSTFIKNVLLESIVRTIKWN